MRLSPNDGFELTKPGTLVDDYKHQQTDRIRSTLPTTPPNDLTDYMARQEFLNKLTVPHVFEVIWMLQHPIFKGFEKYIQRGSAFWSRTPCKIWMPNMNKWRPALYVGFIQKDHKTHCTFEIQKYNSSSDPAYAWLMPVNDTINRGYRTDEDELHEVHESGQFPRDFFEHREHWEAFNKYSRLTKVDQLLKPRGT